MCREYYIDTLTYGKLETNNVVDECDEYRPYFYVYLIHYNLITKKNQIDFNKKLEMKTIKDYIILIYKFIDKITNESELSKNITMYDTYCGNSDINGFVASLYFLQQLKKILDF